MAADIFSDPARMEELVAQIELMAQRVDTIAEKLMSGGQRVVETTGKAKADIKDAERSMHNVEKAAEQTQKHVSDFAKAQRKMKDDVTRIMALWEDAGPLRKMGITLSVALEGNYRKFHEYRGRLDKEHDAREREYQEGWRRRWDQVSKARGKVGTAGDMLGMSGTRGAANMLRSRVMDLMRGLPAGGVLGMMLLGAQQNETFRAQASGILRVFDQVKHASASMRASVHADVKQFTHDFGELGPELAATMEGFVKGGLAKQAETRLGARGSGPKAYKVATALDMATSSQAGTAAQALGTVTASTGENIQSITTQLMGLRAVARDAGISYSALLGTLTQGVSVMRMQGQGVEDLARSYENMRRGFRAAGMSQAQAGQAALKGTESLASGFGGLSDGFLGYLARRSGKGGDPFDAMMEFKLNMSGDTMGKDKDKASKTAFMIQDVINERFSGHSLAGKIGAGARLTGLNEEQVRAIMMLRKDSKEGYDKLTSAFKDPMKLLREAVNNKLSAVDQNLVIIKRLQQSMGDIGLGILTHVILGFKSLVALGSNLGNADARANIAANYLRISDKASNRITKGISTIGADLGGYGSTLLSGVGEAMGDLTMSPGALKKAERDRVNRIKQEAESRKIREDAKRRSEKTWKDDEKSAAEWRRKHSKTAMMAPAGLPNDAVRELSETFSRAAQILSAHARQETA